VDRWYCKNKKKKTITFILFDIRKINFKKENGHKEDILCISKSDSNFLATSSYDGEIIVWNIISGHIYCKLNSPKPLNYNDENCKLIKFSIFFF